MYDEPGRVPIMFNIECRILGYWFKLITEVRIVARLACLMYKLIRELEKREDYESDFILAVKNCFK